MLSYLEEYRYSVCEVKTMANELISTGIISDVNSEYLEITDKTGVMQSVGFGTWVKINVFNSRKGFRVLSGKVYTSCKEFIRCVEVTSLVEYERRHFFRVETKLRAQAFLGDSIPAANDDPPDEEISVVVYDLSLGGALIQSPIPLTEGQSLVLRMKLGRGIFPFRCEVRRVLEEKLQYGCMFREMSGAQDDALCAYIFQRQRERINTKG